MNKIQKVWLGLFITMFIVPEVLFSFLTSLVLFKIDFSPLMFHFLDEQFFLDHQNYIFIFVVIEILGLIGLFIYNKRFNHRKYTSIISVLLTLLLLILLFIFYVSFSLRHGFSI